MDYPSYKERPGKQYRCQRAGQSGDVPLTEGERNQRDENQDDYIHQRKSLALRGKLEPVHDVPPPKPDRDRCGENEVENISQIKRGEKVGTERDRNCNDHCRKFEY